MTAIAYIPNSGPKGFNVREYDCIAAAAHAYDDARQAFYAKAPHSRRFRDGMVKIGGETLRISHNARVWRAEAMVFCLAQWKRDREPQRAAPTIY